MPEIVTLHKDHNPWKHTIHLIVKGITQDELRHLWKLHGVRYKRCLQLTGIGDHGRPRSLIFVLTIFQTEADKTAAMILI